MATEVVIMGWIGWRAGGRRRAIGSVSGLGRRPNGTLTGRTASKKKTHLRVRSGNRVAILGLEGLHGLLEHGLEVGRTWRTGTAAGNWASAPNEFSAHRTGQVSSSVLFFRGKKMKTYPLRHRADPLPAAARRPGQRCRPGRRPRAGRPSGSRTPRGRLAETATPTEKETKNKKKTQTNQANRRDA